jgi:hypothetical protein
VTVVGSCFDIGLHLVAVPSILKVRPMPASTGATLELSLEEWNNVTVVLYDARGVAVYSLPEQLIAAGAQSLTLDLTDVPAGIYTLAVETVYGRSVVALHVRR